MLIGRVSMFMQLLMLELTFLVYPRKPIASADLTSTLAVDFTSTLAVGDDNAQL